MIAGVAGDNAELAGSNAGSPGAFGADQVILFTDPAGFYFLAGQFLEGIVGAAGGTKGLGLRGHRRPGVRLVVRFWIIGR